MKRIKGVSSVKRASSIDKKRISVSRSSRHLYVQLIDDREAITLVGLSTKSASVNSLANVKGAALLGKVFAKMCMEKGVSENIYMDRRGRRYAGVLSSFADAARNEGLKF